MKKLGTITVDVFDNGGVLESRYSIQIDDSDFADERIKCQSNFAMATLKDICRRALMFFGHLKDDGDAD